MSVSAVITADAKALVERAEQLLKARRCSCLYTGLAIARSEAEATHRAQLTHAVALAYTLLETRAGTVFGGAP